jgi:hypothetical protein
MRAAPMIYLGHSIDNDSYVSMTADSRFLTPPQNSNLANNQIGMLYTQRASESAMHDYSTLTAKTVGEEMTTPTKEEIDLKLALAEARTETRFVELSAKMERMIDAVDRSNADHLRTANEAKEEWRAVNQNVTKEGKSTRNVIIGTIIAALAALLVTQATLIAAFQTGITLHDSHSPSPKP